MSNIMIRTLSALDAEDNYKLLAKHMPPGRMWTNSFDRDTNLGKLVQALSVEYYRLSILLEDEIKEYDIDQTFRLLEKWEESVGIPSSLFKREGVSLENRRKNVKYLLTNFWGVQTADDFVRVAAFFDYDVNIYAARDIHTFPLYFPVYFYSQKSVLFTIIVSIDQTFSGSSLYFPLYFPYYFNDGGVNFLNSLFELLAPANCNLKFINNI